MSWFLNYTETPAPHPLVDTEAMRAATSAACAGALYRLPSTSLFRAPFVCILFLNLFGFVQWALVRR
jgi:hypothetical protein